MVNFTINAIGFGVIVGAFISDLTFFQGQNSTIIAAIGGLAFLVAKG